MQLPHEFTIRTKALLGDEWPAFERSLQEKLPVSIRWNPAKKPSQHALACVEAVPWASQACYLAERPSFTLDPLFHAGCYYVQEASSMYLEQIVKQHVTQSVKVLDLCAAPGGKSTQLAAVLPEKSLLVSNEVIRSRAFVLTENLVKWGCPYTIVTNNDPVDMSHLPSFFDVVMVDAPCSGEGMFRKDPAAFKEWSIHTVKLCAERQKRIVADSWPALKTGGLLIYSTCTYNREENEENIEWICRELGAEMVEEPHRFMPHKTKGEGFFIAAVRKTGRPLTERKPDLKRTKADNFSAQAIPDRKKDLLHPEWFTIFPEKGRFVAFPAAYSADYLFLRKYLRILSAGIPLGEQKGKDWIPAHELALSTELAPAAFPVWEVDQLTALRYLRKEALQDVPAGLPQGYILVSYCRQPLGFVKNIGSRANNLYPPEWRIRLQ